jgi:transcriptional regulator with XRE-family HTH domain
MDKLYNTAQRLQQLIKDRGLRQVDILAMTKPISQRYGFNFGKSALSQYVTGMVEPRQYKLYVLAEALDVSPVWLMGFDVPMERNENLAPGSESELDNEVSIIFSELPSEKKAAAAEYLRFLANSKEK